MIAGIKLVIFSTVLTLAHIGQADANENIQRYFNEIASEVKAIDNPNIKREILNNSFETVTNTLTRVSSAPFISDTDRSGIENLKAVIQQYQDELAGENGLERVSDGQLDDFSEYVVQNLEQATRYITLSVGTAILIGILLLLL
jgi:hypothetical protein